MAPTKQGRNQAAIGDHASSKAKRSYTKIDLAEFLEEVRKHPFLYDKKQTEFKDTGKKSVVWTAIGDMHGITGKEAAEKWKNLKKRYSSTRNAEKTSRKSGAGTADVVVPNWKEFPIMDSIMRDCTYENTQSVTNISPEVVEFVGSTSQEDIDDSTETWKEFFHMSSNNANLSTDSIDGGEVSAVDEVFAGEQATDGVRQ